MLFYLYVHNIETSAKRRRLAYEEQITEPGKFQYDLITLRHQTSNSCM